MAYSLIGSTSQAGTLSGNVVTPDLDTSGATLIVLACSWYGGGGGSATGPITSNKAGTYSQGLIKNDAGQLLMSFWVADAPTVGANHNWTMTNDATYLAGAVTVSAWSGAANPAYDQAAYGESTNVAGPITPSSNDALLVACYANQCTTPPSVNSPFSVLQDVPAAASVNQGITLAYVIQTTATSQSVTWTPGSGGSQQVTGLMSLLSGSGPPPSGDQPMMRRWGGRSGPVPGIGQSSGGGKAWG